MANVGRVRARELKALLLWHGFRTTGYQLETLTDDYLKEYPDKPDGCLRNVYRAMNEGDRIKDESFEFYCRVIEHGAKRASLAGSGDMTKQSARLIELAHVNSIEHLREIFAAQDRTYRTTSSARFMLRAPSVANRVLKLAEPVVLESGNEACFFKRTLVVLMGTVDSYAPSRRRSQSLNKLCLRHLRNDPLQFPSIGSLAYALGKRGYMATYVEHLRLSTTDPMWRAWDAERQLEVLWICWRRTGCNEATPR